MIVLCHIAYVLALYSRVLPLFGRNEFIESKSGSSRSAKTCLFFFISNTVFSLRIIFVDLRDRSTVLKKPDFWLFLTMLLVTLLDSWSDTWRGVGHIWPQLFDRFLKPWMSSLSKSSLLQDYTVKLILFIFILDFYSKILRHNQCFIVIILSYYSLNCHL